MRYERLVVTDNTADDNVDDDTDTDETNDQWQVTTDPSNASAPVSRSGPRLCHPRGGQWQHWPCGPQGLPGIVNSDDNWFYGNYGRFIIMLLYRERSMSAWSSTPWTLSTLRASFPSPTGENKNAKYCKEWFSLWFHFRIDDFAKLNCQVMAMSTDSVYSHKAFVKASK